MNATPPVRSTRREAALFFLFAFVLLAAGIGLRDPWPSDEPRFTLVAKQMVESGEWMFPHRGVELYSDKPPTLMWLEALGYEIFGHWRIAFLLPSLLAALATLWLVYDLGKRLWTPRTGLYAAGALLCVVQFVYQSKRAQIDPLVTFFITAANYGLLRHFLLGPDWRAYWLGCFAAGLGVITKGVGVLALALFLPYLFARWRGWNGLARIESGGWRWAAGALALLAAIALWLGPMLWAAHAHGTPEYRAYVQDILFHQTAGRYTDSWDHHHPATYYLVVVLFSWLPLSLAYPGTFPRWWERLRARDARFLLPLAWVVLVVLFFSIPKGKRDVYIMPALPMLALVSGPFLGELIGKRWLRAASLALVALLGAGFVGAGLWALAGHPAFAQRFAEQRGLESGGAAMWWMLLAMGAALLAAAAVCRLRRGTHALLAGLTALWLLWSLWAYPLLNPSSSAAGVMQKVGAIVGPDAELGMVAWKEQNLLMADRPAVDFGFGRPWHEQLAAALAWQRQVPARRWVFVQGAALGPCIDRSKAVYVGHANRREWWLFRADAAVPGCVPAPAVDSGENPNAD